MNDQTELDRQRLRKAYWSAYETERKAEWAPYETERKALAAAEAEAEAKVAWFWAWVATQEGRAAARGEK